MMKFLVSHQIPMLGDLANSERLIRQQLSFRTAPRNMKCLRCNFLKMGAKQDWMPHVSMQQLFETRQMNISRQIELFSNVCVKITLMDEWVRSCLELIGVQGNLGDHTSPSYTVSSFSFTSSLLNFFLFPFGVLKCLFFD
jgi:hypothetical protein